MGRKPCYDSKDGLNKGPWAEDEDLRLTQFIRVHGEGCSWSAVPKKAGLKRCGKSCRFRWVNYLRPSVKRGDISPDEEDLIIRLHKLLGNRWSLIAGRIPGRTDNEVKNYWNTRLNKKAHSSGCIGWKSTKPRKANISEQAVSILTPKSANQEGEKEKVICNPVIEDLKKGSTSSNYCKKQEASSSSDSRKLAAVSAEMDLWNSLQLNLNILPSWAYSNILHDDFKSAFLPEPFVYNEENVHPLSCMFDTENVWQDYVDHQMYSNLHNSLPSSEVGVNSDTVTVVPHMNDFADIFNSFPI